MTDQPVCLLRRDNSYIAQLCAGCRSLKTNDYPAHPGLSFSGNHLSLSSKLIVLPLFENTPSGLLSRQFSFHPFCAALRDQIQIYWLPLMSTVVKQIQINV